MNAPEIPVIPGQAVLRNVCATRFTVEIAERKANAVILSGVPSGDLRQNRADIREKLNHVRQVLVPEGGLPISGPAARW